MALVLVFEDRLWVAGLFAALVVLAGCTAPAPADDGAGMPEPSPGARLATEVEVTLTGCGIMEAFASAPADVVRPHVPPDFSLFLGETGEALVVLGGLVCGEDAALSERGIVAVFVTPDDPALSAGDDVNHFWEPEHVVVTSSAIGATFAALGADLIEGRSVTYSESPVEATLQIEAEGTHTVSGSPGGGPGGELAEAFGHFREYAAADGGYVYLEARFQGHPGTTFSHGVAEVSTAEDTVARALLGAASTWPYVGGVGIEYADARVGFIPR